MEDHSNTESKDTRPLFPFAWAFPGQMYDGTHYVLRDPPSGEAKGSTVVLVHGIGSFHTSFDQIVNILVGAGHRTLQYDLYGRGFSEPSPSGVYDDDAHLEQLEKLLKHLRQENLVSEKIHLVGHSMGGALVCLFATKYPKEILSVTACTPAGLMNSWALGMLGCLSPMQSWLKPMLVGRPQMIHAVTNEFHLTYGIFVDRKNEFLRQMILQADNNPHIYDALWKSLLDFPLNDISDKVEDLASHSHLRVLILWARHDITIPIGSNLKRWESILDNGQCRWRSAVIEDAGHAFIVEHFEKAAEEIMRTINDAESGAEGTSTEHVFEKEVDVCLGEEVSLVN
jgi:pimeloyl-ACP methyl ester carboxylesterase